MKIWTLDLSFVQIWIKHHKNVMAATHKKIIFKLSFHNLRQVTDFFVTRGCNTCMADGNAKKAFDRVKNMKVLEFNSFNIFY